jgi:hypothetical protein
MVSNAIYSPTSAQTFTKQKIEQLSRVQFHKIIPEYREFLSLHNDGHYPDQIQTNLQEVKHSIKENLAPKSLKVVEFHLSWRSATLPAIRRQYYFIYRSMVSLSILPSGHSRIHSRQY